MASRVTKAKEQLGRFNHDKNQFETVLSLGMKYGFIILNLKQKLNQSMGTGLPPKKFKLSPSDGTVMLVACLGFTLRNAESFHAKRPNCGC